MLLALQCPDKLGNDVELLQNYLKIIKKLLQNPDFNLFFKKNFKTVNG